MTVGPVIRTARVDDLPEITRIRTSVRENHLSVEQLAERGITEETIAIRMRSGNLGAWVATIGGAIAAFAMADKTTGNIFALFTSPDHEGRGCGSLLLSACENWLHAHGVATAFLDTDKNSRAVAFYSKRGWTVDHRDLNEVYMKKSIEALGASGVLKPGA